MLSESYRSQQRVARDLRSKYRDEDLAWFLGTIAAWVVSAVDQSGQYRTPPRELEPWLTDPDLAWLFTNLTQYDPTQLYWGIPDLRMAPKHGQHLWWVFDPDFGWIQTNLPPAPSVTGGPIPRRRRR